MTLCCNNTKTATMLNRMYSVRQLLELQYQLNDKSVYGKGWPGAITIDAFNLRLISNLVKGMQDSQTTWSYDLPANMNEYKESVMQYRVVMAMMDYLSMSILRIITSLNGFEVCKSGNPFSVYDNYYIGTDMGNMFTSIGIVYSPNVLNHGNMMRLIKEISCSEWDYYGWVDVLDKMATSVHMYSEHLSALYAVLHAQAMAPFDSRVTSGQYVWNGTRFDPEEDYDLVEDFLNSPEMTLTQLRENVFNYFYTEAVP